MAEKLDPKEIVTPEEIALSNMWEIAALVEVLEQKGICKKQDLYDAINTLRRKQPHAPIPETFFPEPYLLTETQNKLIDHIIALFNDNGLTSHQAKQLLGRLGVLIEAGEKLARKKTH